MLLPLERGGGFWRPYICIESSIINTAMCQTSFNLSFYLLRFHFKKRAKADIPGETFMDADYADDLALPENTMPSQILAARGIGLYVSSD